MIACSMFCYSTMETADAMLVFNKYDEMIELIQRLVLIYAHREVYRTTSDMRTPVTLGIFLS